MVTIILPVSRPDFLRRIFAQLDMMPCNTEQTNIFVYVDGDQRLYELARNLTVASKFKQKLCVYRHKGLPDISSIRRRRQRIADIHNEIKKYVNKCQYVFLLEDDTVIPLNTFEKMIKNYSQFPHAGFISGVQVGRWGFTALGVWKVDNPYDVTKITSQLPDQNPLIGEVDATGMYCMMTKWELYQSVSFQPFNDWLGPDVHYGIELRKEGYRNYVDWTINTTHLTKKEEIKLFNTKLQQVVLTKQGDQWAQEIKNLPEVVE